MKKPQQVVRIFKSAATTEPTFRTEQGSEVDRLSLARQYAELKKLRNAVVKAEGKTSSIRASAQDN